MTPGQLQQLRDVLAANRQPAERGDRYAFPRGWNECLDFVERTMRDVLGERDPDKGEVV